MFRRIRIAATFILLILLAGNCFAQARTNNFLLYIGNLPDQIDTCIHEINLDIQGFDAVRFINCTVSDSTVASVTGKMLYIHKRGTVVLTVNSLHPTTPNLTSTDTTLHPEAVVYNLTIGPPPMPNVHMGLKITNCTTNTDSIILVATTITGSVYQWRVNGVPVTPTTDSTFVTSSLKINDTVSCTVTNIGACVSYSGTGSIVIVPLKPVITASPSANPICAGTSVTFTTAVNNAGATPNYQWQINGQNVGANSNVFVSSTIKDNDVVTCLISDSFECLLPVSSNPVVMHVADLPTISISKNITLDFGTSKQLSPAITGSIASYQWLPADGLSDATIAAPVASPKNTTTYNLLVTTVNGCQAQASVTITVVIFIPNAFTPNGDGINDTWNISALSYYPNATVNVFNRYGSVVMHSQGYPKAWDGTYAGKAMPAGTYYYIIDTGVNKFSGSVTVIR